MTNNGSTPQLDVAVVGCGQAGLAIGYHLARQGRTFVIFERADMVGAAWRDRWTSLVLFTPRRYDSLPGLAFPGDPNGYPTRDEVIAYLKTYSETFALPIETGTAVRSLTKEGDTFVLGLDGRTIETGQVVIATGPFQKADIPAVAGQLDQDVFQTHSANYRSPSDVPQSTVLVVGGGNTGFQIATELSPTHTVHLAIGSRQTPLPQKILGRDLFWWLVTTRLLNKTVESRLGQKLRHRDTLIGSSPHKLRMRGVHTRARVTEVSERTVSFADGAQLEVDAVIWATGFGLDHAWIDLPISDATGEICQRRGVTDIPGLYFLGLPWQHTRGSALLGWVKDDAAYLAEQIATHASAVTTTRPAPVPVSVAIESA